MVVAKQRTNPDKTVARLAQEIVQKWKAAVDEEKKAKALPKADKWMGADPAKRKWASDGVDIKRTGAPTRDNGVGLIYNGLAHMSKESCTAVILKAMEVEKAAFTEYKGDTDEYRKKIRSLFMNLKQNKALGPQIMSGSITAERFVVMTLEELKSEKMKKEEVEFQKENMKKAQVPMAEKSISDALRCGKCGQKKVSYSQAQTRSADEPMTTFCECTVCGNRWKVSAKLTRIVPALLTLHSSSLKATCFERMPNSGRSTLWRVPLRYYVARFSSCTSFSTAAVF